MSIRIPVILGSSRVGRKSVGIARYVEEQLRGWPEVETRLIDLAELNLPVMDYRLSEMQDPPAALVDLSETFRSADGLVIVTPEYKNGIPGVLKNALDYLEADILRRTPVGICTVSSGEFGGINCLAHLRLVILAMGGVPIPLKLAVSNVKDLLDEQGAPDSPTFASRARRFLEEMLWYTERLK